MRMNAGPNNVINLDSAIIDVFNDTFKRDKKLLLMRERNPKITNGTVVHYAGLHYFVQEIVLGNKGRIGLKVVEHGN